MTEIVADVHSLAGIRHGINAYLVEDVLVDARTKWAARTLLNSLADYEVNAHALTHVHPDHQGASAAVCRALGIPYWVPAPEAETAESGAVYSTMPRSLVGRLQQRLWVGPGHPVDRRLRAGDDVAGFEVVETPGHSAGHVSYWREADGTLVLGDVLVNMHLLTTRPGLHEPPQLFTSDPAQNRDSARTAADLEPDTVLFGHGPPLTDGTAFVNFVATLSHD
ncbi:MBL fold metallo-hydrolase [Halorubrum halophilum]|uniref:MBL fold metallo-hydrolase n=1 Tax=Halorubrum halophilum TaxID=413816 RepID=UPI00186B207A|nr:MBL fold metallo-hydrolase [Halorubrum halophilum]